MKFTVVSNSDKRKSSDLLVVPFFKEKKKIDPATSLGSLQKLINGPIDANDFHGKEGELIFIYSSTAPEKRIALLGLGEKAKLSVETLRRSYSAVAKACQQKKLKSLNILSSISSDLDEGSIVKGISEGLLLSNYSFEQLKKDSLKDGRTILIEKVCLVGSSKKGLSIANKMADINEGVQLARDLVNGNAHDITPQALALNAKNIAKRFKNVKATVFDKKRIEKEKMGLLLAVNQGSVDEPAFIILEYKGNPKSKDITVVVGKGVTYDTGGLNLKPTGSMETMKCDMGGSAVALGTILAAANSNLKKNIIAVIPTTENSIGKNSYKPGDVYAGYSGKTVEIGNTDAEGRLILADALAYASKKLNPSRIIDFATLTGAIVIALGEETTGLMSNDDSLADALTAAGQNTFERVWRMPLFEEYKKQLDSDVADIKNTGGREAGSITAALFLQEFVGDIPWAHLDIAGTAYLSSPRRYHPKNATGVGVRLMIEFLENIL